MSAAGIVSVAILGPVVALMTIATVVELLARQRCQREERRGVRL